MSADLMPASVQFKGEIMDFDLGMEIDHRKRRRNRTTQSCLNCHTSKRKCDRKRPCQRCIQLGLTGLCVYEVDDPALRDDPNVDETTRLRNRIAELESLVRELRGKPHPRWAEPNYCDGDATEKWHSRASRRTQLQIQRQRQLEGTNGGGSSAGSASPPGGGVKSEQSTESPHQPQLYRLSPSPGPTLALDNALGYRDPHAHHAHSQGSTSASGCSSPGDPCAYTSAGTSAASSPALGYSRHTHAHGGVLDLYYHQPYIRDGAPDGACACLTNPAAAHPLIALTNQLQTTTELMRALPEHAGRVGCGVLKQIAQLNDLMHGNTSGAMQTPSPPFDPLPTPESELMSPVSPASHGHAAMQQEWSALAAGPAAPYDSYFPESSLYHKTYQLN